MRGRKLFFSGMVLGTLLISQVVFGGVKKDVVAKYPNEVPSSVKVNLKTDAGRPQFLNYVFVKSQDAPIREDASIYSKVITRMPFNAKMQILEKVVANGNEWYKVVITDTNGEKQEGYVSAMLVSLRVFRFEEMDSRIKKLEKFVKEESAKGRKLAVVNTYAPNPSSSNMDRSKDKYGVSKDQNATASYKGETIYIPDRSILSVESTEGNTAYVNVASIPERPLKVNKGVLSYAQKINPNFRKVIVLDLENENQGVFQKNSDGEWELIAYTLNKSGAESNLGFETPRGDYLVAMAKYEMPYRNEQNKPAGYAKYAIRFCGGAYLHGTPIEYKENINRDFFLKEKDGTLGTIEGTRKCIRNMEPHIKFLFDWVTNGKVNRNSNVQNVAENVMVIAF